jgi:hypothetical protein
VSYDVAVPFCVRPQPAAVAFGRLARNLKELKQLKSVWGDGVSTTREGQMAIVTAMGCGSALAPAAVPRGARAYRN